MELKYGAGFILVLFVLVFITIIHTLSNSLTGNSFIADKNHNISMNYEQIGTWYAFLLGSFCFFLRSNEFEKPNTKVFLTNIAIFIVYSLTTVSEVCGFVGGAVICNLLMCLILLSTLHFYFHPQIPYFLVPLMAFPMIKVVLLTISEDTQKTNN